MNNKELSFCIEEERNFGIDALRIVAMFLVVVLHVLGCGGVLESSQNTAVFAICWLLEISAYCAVDCYALISGYVGYSPDKKTQRYSRYMDLWLQVVFYGGIITALLKLFNFVDLGMGGLIAAILPVSFNQYWYFTAYTGVFLLMPYFNQLVFNIDKKMAYKLILLMLFLFSLFSVWATEWGGGHF